jgi:hypothetical protein
MDVSFIMNIHISTDLSYLDPESIDEKFGASSISNAFGIFIFGNIDDDEFQGEHYVVKNADDVTIFCGSNQDLAKSDPEDDESDPSLMETLDNLLSISENFEPDVGYEILDLLENLAGYVDPKFAIGHLRLKNKNVIGGYEIKHRKKAKLFVTRYLLEIDEVDTSEIGQDGDIEDILDEAGEDAYEHLDTAILVL